MQYFLWFLAIILCAELVATYLIEVSHTKTYTLYNIVNVSILVFYAAFYLQAINKINNKRFIYLLVFTFIGWWLYDNMNSGTFHRFNYLHFVLAAVVQIVFVLLFFYEYLITNDITNTKQCQFTVSIGVLLYNLGVILVFAFAKSIKDAHIQFWGQPLHFQIPRMLCIPLYTCLALSLLKWKPTK